MRNGPDHITLVRKYYLLKPFLASPISASFLTAVQADLDACRSAGVKLVPRFTYIRYTASANQDAPLPIALQHVAQLAPILQANVDVLAYLEAGFVGHYGEWNSSDQGYIDNFTLQPTASRIALRDALLAALPVERSIAMRYLFWHKIQPCSTPLDELTAYTGSDQARIGIHNDAIMTDATWRAPSCGVCPTYAEMLTYLENDSRWSVSAGEPCDFGDPYWQNNDPRPQLRTIHQSTLIRNSFIDYTFWDTPGWSAGLTRDLGYRFTLDSMSKTNSAVQGGTLPMAFYITNSGYAATYNPRALELILRNTNNGNEVAVDLLSIADALAGPRYWQPGAHTFLAEVPIEAALPEGTYALFLSLPDPAPALHDDPRYSIRLANDGLWDPVTGLHDLQRTVQVNNGTTALLAAHASNTLLFPNPFHDSFFLKCALDAKVVINDALGRVLYEGDGNHAVGAAWPEGAYHVRIVERSAPRTIVILKIGLR